MDPEDHTCNSGEDDAALLAHAASKKRMLHMTEVGTPPSGDNLEACLKGPGSSKHTYVPDEYESMCQSEHAQPPTCNMKDIHNFRVTDSIHPSAIVFATEEQHVVVAVTCAYKFNKPVYGRSGMNQYEASCADETGGGAGCVIVDTNNIQDINWTSSACDWNGQSGCIASLGPGLSLGTAYKKMADRRYTLPAGTCASVRVAGLTLGGGKGWLTRKYGLTLDRLRGISAVLLDGTRVDADNDTEEHLFWLARGGGGNIFPGVVTAFHFELVPLPERIPTQEMTWETDSHQCLSSVMDQWYQQMATYSDNDLWSRLTFENPGTSKVRIETKYFGTSSNPAKQKLFDVSAAAGCSGKFQDYGEQEWVQTVLDANGKENFPEGEKDLLANNCGWDLSGDKPVRTTCYGYDTDWDKYWAYRSLLPGENGTVSPELWDTLAGTSMNVPDPSYTHNFYIEIDPTNGFMANISSNATAYPHRGAGFVTIQQVMRSPSKDQIESFISQSAALFKNMTQYAPEKGAYYNYLDKDMGAYGAVPRHSYYGANADRVETYVREYTEGINMQGGCSRCRSWELNPSPSPSPSGASTR
jgi:hypothetical protein